MPGTPLVVYCIRDEPECPILASIRKAAEAAGSEQLAARVLRVNVDNKQQIAEAWLRVSGGKDAIKAFEDVLRKSKGVAFQQIYVSKFNAIYRVLIPGHRGCTWFRETGYCPLAQAPVGFMNKSVVVTPEGILHEYIIAWKKGVEYLKSMGCEVVLAHGIDEYDYMLSAKQEQALIYAYLMGYYTYPRKVSLKELAAKLGLSVSTLAELLRKAEAKVVEAFVRHELPHYLVKAVKSRAAQLKALEENLRNNRRREKASETTPT